MQKSFLNAWIVTFLLCPLLYGQSDGRLRADRSDPGQSRSAGLSELAKENLNHVAASSAQIREVLPRLGLKRADLYRETKVQETVYAPHQAI